MQALYGQEMRALSGGLVYEYSAEEAGYGLVEINQDGSVKLMKDFDNLQQQFNQLDIEALESASAQSTDIEAPECGDSLITADEFSKNFTIPAVCPNCQSLIDNGISNPKNGKLVDVSATKPKQQIYGSNGALIQGLSLNKIGNDGVNAPGQQSTTPSSASGSGGPAQPTESKKGAAPKLAGGALAWIVVLVSALLV